jgi:hypothetical protein
MTDKFTIRDFLVYSLVGLTATLIFYTHEPCKVTTMLNNLIAFSDFAIIIFVPIFYLIGHVIMGIDDIIFNNILYRPIRKKYLKKSNWFWKVYTYLLFGYRNQGLKMSNQISEDDFLITCDKLIGENIYQKAEYYQVMSDLFKGVFLCLIASIIYRLFNCNYSLWELSLTAIIWYRARVFSSYYVRLIKRNIK